MATNTVYLKPSADILLEHNVYPETLSAGYLAISEEVNDEGSTYIEMRNADTENSLIVESSFKLSMDTTYRITNINSMMFKIWSDGRGVTDTYTVKDKNGNILWYVEATRYTDMTNDELVDQNGNVIDTYDGGKTTGTYDCSSLVSILNNLITQSDFKNDFPDLTLHITTNLQAGTSKSDQFTRISQFVFMLECECASNTDINYKANGTWMPVKTVYRKVDGAWTEMTVDECKNLLSTNLLTLPKNV
jgi:hypothetical protein